MSPSSRAVCASVRATISHLGRAYEVWLIVLGALLFLAFPRLYAVSFSGFYLAFMVLLWCLIGRGLALVWFVIGLVLIGIYMLVTHRPFTGRVHSEGEGY